LSWSRLNPSEETDVKHSCRIAPGLARVVLLVALAVTGAAAWGQDPGARGLAANCTGCHGPNGNSAGAIPTIAGLEKAYFVTAMREFKSGARQATIMHQHAKGYNDQEIDILADYFSRQQRQ
jgi:cytochrome subunit of sulfide dehydrogenase